MRALLVVALLVVSVAVAQTVTDQFKVTLQPQQFKADVITGQRLGAHIVNVDGGLTIGGGAAIRRSYQGTRSGYIPVLGSSPSEKTCHENFAITSTGTLPTHFCTPSTTYGADAGDPLPPEVTMTCRAWFDKTYVKLCVNFSDGGNFGGFDAGWSTITFGP